MEQPVVVDVQHVTMKFNLSTEKVDNLKEYFIRTLKRNIMYNEFTALDDVSFQVAKGRGIRPGRPKRLRQEHNAKAGQRHLQADERHHPCGRRAGPADRAGRWL